MKKILSVLCLCLLIVFSFTMTALAVGDSNIDSGGSSMGDGTSSSYWISGMDGVRVTVVRSSDYAIMSTPIDLTNNTISSSVYHFGQVCKLQYTNGATLVAQQGGYTYYNPSQSLPTIVSSSGTSNIDAIESYFTDEQVIRAIAEITGFNYDTLINGNYKLLLEPIAYYYFQGAYLATTATESAMYDELVGGALRSSMVSLTHQNLPLAMFLEVSDLGYPAWTGSTTSAATDAEIKSSLGLGVVRFEEELEAPQVSVYDYEYRVNTEVITSVYVSGGQSDPDDDTIVYFTIDGTVYSVSNVYYPSDDGQLVWVKWTTPSEPQEMVINVSVSGPGDVSSATITCNIIDLDENPPPNPVADDRNDGFSYASVPSRTEVTWSQWSVWVPWWQEYWVDNGYWDYDSWVDSEGEFQTSEYWVSQWEDEGWWEFDCDIYTASLSASMELTNDTYNPTATGSTLKSGYGVNISVASSVSATQNSAVTSTPNAVSYFPEFNYTTYWRLLERMTSGTSCTFEFQQNVYSTYNNRTHFTPIWYPDGNYTVNTWLIDVWTPSGMLSMNLADSLTISGNLWDDWHIAPKDTN